ncbi:hypothetical protein Kisp01_13250 [Kineosporia sp. NBRC 101677]|uniref:DUF3027 domain-containing protein n=1 Tax=Kineosporia sp. NBRC 101677 TaxID=3032197 RepID=UPI0024A026DB|nr:DUF3027 domain-containing protein [Kineosporia sp. NBRC 101677]GLY14309.1 hypothetical protein Kisp01_13250 [Kineosporia sp. NBRC 101677]
MTDQQVTGSVREAEAPVVPEQADAQVEAPPQLPTEPDPLAVAAVDLAREAAEEVAQPGTVGRHLSVSLEKSSGLTMHAFDCTAKGYRGWRWAVTLAHVPGSERVTVCDTVLLPGAESIMAPDWVPWSDRLAPGDLGAGDELPYKLDDPNLVPGYTVTDEDDADQQLFWELGLGRERVLGPEGLAGAAGRWQRGAHGPTSEIAIQASASCVSCAYFVPLSGRMRQHFGACANEWSPADGSVVTTDFGCGAHSETDLEMPTPEPLGEHILDETVVDRIDLAAAEPAPGIETGSSEVAVGTEDVGAGSAGSGTEASGPVGTEDDGTGSAGGDAQASGRVGTEDDGVGSADSGAEASGPVGKPATDSSESARASTTAGGISSDVVSVEPSEPVAIEVVPSVDPEPVQSPEDVISVRPLGAAPAENTAQEPAEPAETAGAGTSPEAVEGVQVGEIGTREVSPAEVAPGTPPAEAVQIEVAQADQGGQFVQSQPEEDPAPPPALSAEAVAAQGESEIEPGESTEAAQGQAVEAASEYAQHSEDPAELSVGAAVPGASVLESDGALGDEPEGDPGEPEGADVVDAAKVQIGSGETPSDGEPGAAEAVAAEVEERVGESGVGTGADVPEEQRRHIDLAIDSAVAAAEPEPVARPVIEAAERARAGQAEAAQADGEPAQDGQTDAGSADAGHAGTEQAAGEHADAGKAGAEQAEAGQVEAGQADGEPAQAGQTDAGPADAGQAGAGQARAGQADAGLDDAGQAGGEQAEAGQAETGQAEVEQADVEQAEAGQADAARTDGEQTEAGQADVESVGGREEQRPEGEKPQS